MALCYVVSADMVEDRKAKSAIRDMYEVASEAVICRRFKLAFTLATVVRVTSDMGPATVTPQAIGELLLGTSREPPSMPSFLLQLGFAFRYFSIFIFPCVVFATKERLLVFSCDFRNRKRKAQFLQCCALTRAFLDQ